ncbi:MAG: fluoride efflux transporter CrcB [Bacteroidales bacterium]|nr:fluoride efflux transporter CrcB [Bacteroidales bacterium]
MKNVLFIMLGGAMGSALRYLTSHACQSIRWLNMPWGTLAVNVIGCFLLGLLIGLGERYTTLPKEIYLMLTVGLCGSFTTFSTFASDFFRLNNAGQIGLALVYLTVSIVVGFLLFGLGRYVFVR